MLPGMNTCATPVRMCSTQEARTSLLVHHADILLLKRHITLTNETQDALLTNALVAETALPLGANWMEGRQPQQTGGSSLGPSGPAFDPQCWGSKRRLRAGNWRVESSPYMAVHDQTCIWPPKGRHYCPLDAKGVLLPLPPSL